MLLTCEKKGRVILRQTAPEGIKAGEYCFYAYGPKVGKEICLKCREKECLFGFSLLNRNKALRERVLNYVFDASLDDELLLNGIMPERKLYLHELNQPYKYKGKVYSKPCYDEKTGKMLMGLEEECNKKILDVNKLLQAFCE